MPIPGIDAAVLAQLFEQQKGTIIEMFNMFSGGALERASVLALGIMPYISASIIMQLASHMVPRYKSLRKKVKLDVVRSANTLATVLCYLQPSNQLRLLRVYQA